MTEGKVRLTDYLPLPVGSNQYPAEFIETNLAIKLSQRDDIVTVGICPESNSELKELLLNFHRGSTLLFLEISRSELTSYLGSRQEHESLQIHIQEEDKLELDRLANDAPVINLVNSLISDAIRLKASDIHIESFRSKLHIRYRVDGMLQTIKELDISLFPAVASRIKVMSGLNIMEKRLPQDGRSTVFIENSEVDLRVSIVPTVGGESIVLRLFSKKDIPLGLDQLGFTECQINDFRKAGKISNGMVLVTGPTGSGKTTTMNALLREIRNDKLKIITIEDPVEYVIEGLDQIQTNDEIGLTFQSVLKRVLRQDPDIIMIGEIRDVETMELALRAALTGHLVLATLHTRDSVSVVSRLKDMGAEPYLLAAVLRFSMAQRLTRKVCPHCSEAVEPAPHWIEILKEKGISKFKYLKGRGCRNCGNTGYSGRAALFESFFINRDLEARIVRSESDRDIMDGLSGTSFKTLFQDGLDKVRDGVTTLEELERVVLEG